MKKCVLSAMLLFVVFTTLFATAFVSKPSKTVLPVQSAELADVTNLSSAVSQSEDETKILEARFLNMLNHSFVYGEDFNSVEDIVNGSVLALLNLRDSQNEDYISQNYVSSYIFNMYGIEVLDYSKINSDFENKDGYVYILPRGYSKYNHEIVSLSINEDGSYTVKTEVTVSPHDSEEYTALCTTLFVKNANSDFGFSIISSDIENTMLCA